MFCSFNLAIRRAPIGQEFEKLLDTPSHAPPTARYRSAANRHNSFPHAGHALSRQAAPPLRPMSWRWHSGLRGHCISVCLIVFGFDLVSFDFPVADCMNCDGIVHKLQAE